MCVTLFILFECLPTYLCVSTCVLICNCEFSMITDLLLHFVSCFACWFVLYCCSTCDIKNCLACESSHSAHVERPRVDQLVSQVTMLYSVCVDLRLLYMRSMSLAYNELNALDYNVVLLCPCLRWLAFPSYFINVCLYQACLDWFLT